MATSFSASARLFFSPVQGLASLKIRNQIRRGVSVRMMASMPNGSAVNHVVLFKVRQDLDPSKVSAFVGSLNSLATLDGVLYLTVGPIRRIQGPLPFTHMLLSRYPSKEALKAYADHPAHLAAVKDYVLPSCDDVMAVDWVCSDPSLNLQSLGSSLRLAFLKLKEGVDEAVKTQIMHQMGVIHGQLSYGENFSPQRAKGYSLASLAALSKHGADAAAHLLEKSEHKNLESEISIEYVVPPPSSSASL